MTPKRKRTPGLLPVWLANAAAAFLHLGTAVAILALEVTGTVDYCAPLRQNYVVYEEVGDTVVLTPDVRHVGCVRPGWLLFAMATVTGLGHAAVLVPPVFRQYFRWGAAGLNAFAWLEYSVTATLATLVLLLLVGLNELSALVIVASYLAWVNLLGGLVPELTLWHVRQSRGAVHYASMVWIPFGIASLMTLAPWALFFAYYFTAITQRPAGTDAPPLALTISFINTLVQYFNFAVVFAIQRLGEQHAWKFVEKYPYATMLSLTALSAFAKLPLTWLLFGGVFIR